MGGPECDIVVRRGAREPESAAGAIIALFSVHAPLLIESRLDEKACQGSCVDGTMDVFTKVINRLMAVLAS